MKKTITMIALAALFVSCAKEAEQTPATTGEVITVAPTEFHATLETPEPDTRTTLGGENGKKVLWEKDDSISVWPGVFNQAKYTLSAGEGTTSATFTSSQTVTGDVIPLNFALYPYNAEATVEILPCLVMRNVKYPVVQDYRKNSWDKGAMTMLGQSLPADDRLSFYNLAGVLRLTLKGTATIDSIRVSALGADEYAGGVSAIYGITDTSVDMIFTSGKKTVTLKCGETGVTLSETKGTVFNIVIPPIEGGFKVTIFDNTHGLMILQSESVIERNTILNMPAKEYAPNAMDLGLSVYWATCNVGADTPEGYGDYFAWGETTTYYESGHASDDPCTAWKDGKSNGYALGSYSLTLDGGTTFTKYNDTDGKTILEAGDDAATQNCGSAWRMPTIAEFEELRNENNCEWTWTTINGVKGYKVVSNKAGYEDAYIFLPAAGCRYGGSLYDVGGSGYYWSSSLYRTSEAGYLGFSDSLIGTYGDDRYYGQSVRPVSSALLK